MPLSSLPLLPLLLAIAAPLIASGGGRDRTRMSWTTAAPAAFAERRRQPGAAPLYIPIGPPCAGKTTLLARILSPDGAPASSRDITIDDQEGVYLKIPTGLFLADGGGRGAARAADVRLLNRKIHGKTVAQRLYGSNYEMRAVLRRLAGRTGAEQFREEIFRQLGCTAAGSGPGDDGAVQSVRKNGSPITVPKNVVAECLVAAVEKWMEEAAGKAGELDPPTILGPDGQADLFVVEAIFNPGQRGSRTVPSGVNLAQSKLDRLARDRSTRSLPLAWGNTNVRVREFTEALRIAELSRRPVVFVPHVNPAIVPLRSDSGPGDVLLPHAELGELYQRSVSRLVQTGKYVPALAIRDAAFRCDSLLATARKEMEATSHMEGRQDRIFDKFELDAALAKMAGFRMGGNRCVVRIGKSDDPGRGGGGRGRGRAGGGRGRGRS